MKTYWNELSAKMYKEEFERLADKLEAEIKEKQKRASVCSPAGYAPPWHQPEQSRR